MVWNHVLCARVFSSYRFLIQLQLHRFYCNRSVRRGNDEAAIRRLCAMGDHAGTISYLQHLMKGGHSPSQAMLISLLQNQPPRNVLTWLNEYLAANSIPPNEQLGSTLIRSMLHLGQFSKAKDVYEQMVNGNVKVRRKSVESLLEEALQQRDMQLASKLLSLPLLQEANLMTVPESGLSHKVVQVAQSTGDSQLVRQLMAVYRAARLPLDPELAREVESWAKSQPCGYAASETTVNESGVCQQCKQQLDEDTISEEECNRLLQQNDHFITLDAKNFECNNVELHQLTVFRELVAKRGPFTAVLDGSNLAYFQRGKPNISMLIAIAKEALRVFGAPQLLVAREHLRMRLDSEMSAQPRLRSALQGINFVHTMNNISDDYYSLYGCLASGRGSYFISNDQLGDYREHLPHTLKPILQQWQKSRQVAIVRNQDCIKLQLPVSYSVVQWTERGWHLPVKKNDTVTWYCIHKVK